MLRVAFAIGVLATFPAGTRAFGATENVLYCAAGGRVTYRPVLHAHSPFITTHPTRHGIAISGAIATCEGTGAFPGEKPLGGGTFSASGKLRMLAGNFQPSCEDQSPLGIAPLDLKAKLIGFDGRGLGGVTKGTLHSGSIIVSGDEVEANMSGAFSSGPYAHQPLHLYMEFNLDAGTFAAACASKDGIAGLDFGGNAASYLRIGD